MFVVGCFFSGGIDGGFWGAQQESALGGRGWACYSEGAVGTSRRVGGGAFDDGGCGDGNSGSKLVADQTGGNERTGSCDGLARSEGLQRTSYAENGRSQGFVSEVIPREEEKQNCINPGTGDNGRSFNAKT